MHEIPQKITDAVMRQNSDRKAWLNNDSIEQVELMLTEEVHELEEAIEHDLPAFCIASEIGDVLYLGLRYAHRQPEIPNNVQAMIDYAHYICEVTGINPVHAIIMKLVRNDIKYPMYIQNNGYSYEEAKALSKGLYKVLGGDDKFSQAWLDLGEAMVGEYESTSEVSATINLSDPY